MKERLKVKEKGSLLASSDSGYPVFLVTAAYQMLFQLEILASIGMTEAKVVLAFIAVWIGKMDYRTSIQCTGMRP